MTNETFDTAQLYRNNPWYSKFSRGFIYQFHKDKSITVRRSLASNRG